jgi:hypothetical protein
MGTAAPTTVAYYTGVEIQPTTFVGAAFEVD